MDTMRTTISIFAASIGPKSCVVVIMLRLSQLDLSCVIHFCVLLSLVCVQIPAISKTDAAQIVCDQSRVARPPLGTLRSKIQKEEELFEFELRLGRRTLR